MAIMDFNPQNLVELAAGCLKTSAVTLEPSLGVGRGVKVAQVSRDEYLRIRIGGVFRKVSRLVDEVLRWCCRRRTAYP